jgi:hypothetical protein
MSLSMPGSPRTKFQMLAATSPATPTWAHHYIMKGKTPTRASHVVAAAKAALARPSQNGVVRPLTYPERQSIHALSARNPMNAGNM